MGLSEVITASWMNVEWLLSVSLLSRKMHQGHA